MRVWRGVCVRLRAQFRITGTTEQYPDHISLIFHRDKFRQCTIVPCWLPWTRAEQHSLQDAQ